MKIVSTSYINTPEFDDPVAWLDRISFYTGIQKQLARLHEMISIEQINYSGELNRNAVSYRFINFKKRKLWFPRRLHRYIKKSDPDVVLVHGLIFPLQVIQLRWTLGKKTKIVVQHHAEKPFTGFRKFLQRIADRYINAYLFVSEEMGMEWVNQGIIADQKKIVEVMEASSSFQVMSKSEAVTVTKVTSTPVFLWVGRLNANKDPLTVVKAFLQFVQYQPTARLYMIYQTDDLLQQVKDIIQPGDGETVKLVGKVPHGELQAWYNSTDFIISGSHYEGSGIAVCEAMSCGCIPVLTSIQSFRKMTGPGKCGLLYEAGNEKELLAVLLKTKTLDMEKEKAKVLQQFKDELSFEAIGREIDIVITSL